MKKSIIAFLLLVSMIIGLVGCGNTPNNNSSGNPESPEVNEENQEDPIVIAYVGPLTGDNSEYGVGMRDTVQMAIDEQNEKGGLLGRQIELISFDDKNSNEEAVSCAEKIVSDDRVVAVIGHFASGVAMASAPIFEEAGIAILNGSAAHPDYTGMGDCIFRNNVMYSAFSNSVMQTLDYVGAEKFAEFHPNTDAGVSIASEIRNRLDEWGDAFAPQQVAVEMYNEGSVDFSAAITKFIDLGVDTVYTSAAYSSAVPFIKQYKERDPDITIVGADALFAQEFLTLGGEDVEGVFLICNFYHNSETPVVKEFTAKYMEKFGVVPNVFYAQVYDNAYMIFAAIEAGQSAAPSDIVENLYKVSIDGVGGTVKFDAEGEVSKEQVLLTVKDGEYVEVPGVLVPPDEYVQNVIHK